MLAFVGSCSDLDEAEHLRQGLALLWREFEAHFGILFLSHSCPGKILLHKCDNLSRLSKWLAGQKRERSRGNVNAVTGE